LRLLSPVFENDSVTTTATSVQKLLSSTTSKRSAIAVSEKLNPANFLERGKEEPTIPGYIENARKQLIIVDRRAKSYSFFVITIVDLKIAR
jgi:hypothetical protein